MSRKVFLFLYLFVNLQFLKGLYAEGCLCFADRRFTTPPTALRLRVPPSHDAEGGTGPQFQSAIPPLPPGSRSTQNFSRD